MFVFTFKWNRKTALLIVIAAAALLCALILFSGGSSGRKAGGALMVRTNEDRVKFLENLGWETEDEPIEEKTVIIPKEFSKIYGKYNKLQLAQGFDLSQYRGLEATIYTYAVKNYSGYTGNVVADLYVLSYEVIGGDIHSLALDGFMHGLYKKQRA